MIIEKNINKEKLPLKVMFFSQTEGKKNSNFLPFNRKKRDGFIFYNKKNILISKNIKSVIDKTSILNNPTKDGIINIISNNKSKLSLLVDEITLKKIDEISFNKKVSLKKEEANEYSNIFSSMIFSYAKISEINCPDIEKHLKIFEIVSKIIVENIDDMTKEYPNYFKKYFTIFSVLHDIGKISIPNKILYHENLSDEEYEIYKTHINFGLDMIEDLSKSWNLKNRNLKFIAKNIIKDHHENYDGSGYPNHLKGKQISLEGRIISMIDGYSKYFYNKKNTLENHQKAINYLENNKFIRFDPYLVEVFIKNEKLIYSKIKML